MEQDIQPTKTTSFFNINKTDAEKILYERFKENNWLARNVLFLCFLQVVCILAILYVIRSVNIEYFTETYPVLFATLPFLFFLAVILIFFTVTIIYYIFYHLEWEKFKNDKTVAHTTWTTNIGNILKIYD